MLSIIGNIVNKFKKDNIGYPSYCEMNSFDKSFYIVVR